MVYAKKLKKDYPELSEEELLLEAEENNSGVYEFYVPVEARWRVAALPVLMHRELSEKYFEAKAKLEERLNEVERMRYQQQFDNAEQMLNWRGIIEDAIKSNPGINKPRIVKMLGKSRATIERILKQLVATKVVEHRGSKKTGGDIVFADTAEDDAHRCRT